MTICNQNAYRNDRLPPELASMMDSFLHSKRADMFGGEDKFEQFEDRQRKNKYTITFLVYHITYICITTAQTILP